MEFARWVVVADAERTRAVYRRLHPGAAEECGCTPCLNFAAAREQTYPTAARELLEQLGVDHRCEAEVSHFGRLDGGLHGYWAFFHFIGRIEAGRDAAAPPPGGAGYSPELEPAGGPLQLGFTNRTSLVHPAFGGEPVVQVEILAEIPWVLAAPEVD